MNFVTLQLASGAAFFEGMAIVVISVMALGWSRRVILRSLATILALLGIAVVLGSGTPVGIPFYVIWCGVAIASLVIFEKSRRPVPIGDWRKAIVVIFVLLSAGLCISEARFRVQPGITVARGRRIYVIGDSISAGLGNKERTWPSVLAQSTGLDVVNLAQAGATVESANQQIKGIAAPKSIVMLEIGGNDLLGGTTAAEFRQQLEKLLLEIRKGEHLVVMFELPLLPFKNGFGRAQRSLAAKYDLILVPKRCLTAAFGAENGTTDGLHLSQAGHNALAREIGSMYLSR